MHVALISSCCVEHEWLRQGLQGPLEDEGEQEFPCQAPVC